MTAARRRSGSTVLCVITNEFADIEVSINHDGNSDRLRLRDLRGDRAALFDPLELETLVWCGRGIVTAQMDPGLSRWRDPDGE